MNLNNNAEAVFKEEKVFICSTIKRYIYIGEHFSLLISINYFAFYEIHIYIYLCMFEKYIEEISIF